MVVVQRRQALKAVERRGETSKGGFGPFEIQRRDKRTRLRAPVWGRGRVRGGQHPSRFRIARASGAGLQIPPPQPPKLEISSINYACHFHPGLSTHTHTHTHTHSLSLSHTHTHTHSLYYTHSLYCRSFHRWPVPSQPRRFVVDFGPSPGPPEVAPTARHTQARVANRLPIGPPSGQASRRCLQESSLRSTTAARRPSAVAPDGGSWRGGLDSGAGKVIQARARDGARTWSEAATHARRLGGPAVPRRYP